MNTAFMLMAQYNGLAIIPIEKVCADYFTHLTPEMFLRKVFSGQITSYHTTGTQSKKR